jgi:hypothetical protein
MIVYVENPRGKELLALINEFNKVSRYKANIQKSLYFYIIE